MSYFNCVNDLETLGRFLEFALATAQEQDWDSISTGPLTDQAGQFVVRHGARRSKPTVSNTETIRIWIELGKDPKKRTSETCDSSGG